MLRPGYSKSNYSRTNQGLRLTWSFLGTPIVVFRPDVAVSNENDETFRGNVNNFDELNIWVQEKCVPLVREITFENAEELTEEGLPFLILFFNPDNLEPVKDYKAIVETQLISEKRKYQSMWLELAAHF